MRLKRAFKNSASGLTHRLFRIIFNFITRTVFIYTLNAEFVGLNGFFVNILQIFSLTELGIGVSITYCLYKPITDGDEYLTNALMTVFSKLYKAVSIIIVILGISTLPFVHLLINDSPFDVDYLRFILVLFITETAVSYLFSYRSIILRVNEKAYIINIVNIVNTITIFTIQVILLLAFRNYVAYKISEIFIHIISNIVLYIISVKQYPNVKIGSEFKLSKASKAQLMDKIKCSSLSRISIVVANFTDALFISIFFGVYETGLFSNYNLIITTSAYSIIVKILDGAAAGFGKLIAKGNDIKNDFYKFYFIGFWIVSISFTAMFTLINPFVNLWIGKDNLLPFSVTFVLLINFYMFSLNYVVLVMREASGVFIYDKVVSILKPSINLISSLVLIKYFGFIGVFLGTSVSCIICDVILYPIYLYKNLFYESSKKYFKRYAVYMSITGVNSILCGIIYHSISNKSNYMFVFIISCLICIFIPNLIIVFLFRKTEEFLYLRSLFIKLANKVLRIKKQKIT